MNIIQRFISKLINVRCCGRRYSQKSVAVKRKHDEKEDPTLIRNIGILAHIDAGKTTTTERMLFYSGTIHNMGEVHHGNTVTDFMDQERERGITITAASVTFPWENHKINLLDTPGHIDFTMEVEQTLNVMDGAVVVLDSSAGVEAQTITVWKQADKYKIPRLIYMNKMDRPDAGFFQSVHSVEAKLHVKPIVLQLPIHDEDRKFQGVIDLLNLEKFIWNQSDYGITYQHQPLKEEDGKLWENALTGRLKMTEALADLDDYLAELIITEEKNMESVPAIKLNDSIKKVTLLQKGVPILCGSSYKNIGVQLLMNAIINYLPSPLVSESGKLLQCFGKNLSARAFKVRHDEYKGPVTFFRIYSGHMSKSQKIYNMRLQRNEICGKVMIAYADDYEEVDEVGVGNIAAVTGLKETTAGDLVTTSASAMESAKKKLNLKSKDEDVNDVFVVGARVPDPVFFCSIEAPSPAYQSALDKALVELEREDPSLRVSVNNETGQTILAGMGELHIEVIKERIRSEYKIDAELGPLQIAYREALLNPVKESHTVNHSIGATNHSVYLVMSVLKAESKIDDILLLDKSPDSASNISAIFPKHLLAVKQGVESALSYGPKLRCPVVNVQVMLHWLEVGKGTSESVITSATSQCVKKLLAAGGTKLLEPIMSLEIVCPGSFVSSLINDLNCRRRAEIIDTGIRGTDKTILASVPLSELLGYATDLRIMTSGNGSFTMEFQCFREMDRIQEAKAIKSVTGFDP